MATASAAVARAPAEDQNHRFEACPQATPPANHFRCRRSLTDARRGEHHRELHSDSGDRPRCKASLQKIGKAVLPLSAWLQFDTVRRACACVKSPLNHHLRPDCLATQTVSLTG